MYNWCVYPKYTYLLVILVFIVQLRVKDNLRVLCLKVFPEPQYTGRQGGKIMAARVRVMPEGLEMRRKWWWVGRRTLKRL